MQPQPGEEKCCMGNVMNEEWGGPIRITGTSDQIAEAMKVLKDKADKSREEEDINVANILSSWCDLIYVNGDRI